MFSSAVFFFFPGLNDVCPKGILSRLCFQDGEHTLSTQQLDCQQGPELQGRGSALKET